MKLTQLLKIHTEYLNPESLNTNLGDGYLYKNNSIYRNIRQLIQSKKINLSHQPNLAYQALPLAELQNILTEKTIPYFDNVTYLNLLDQKRRDIFYWDEVVDQVKKNNLLHESCHAVFHDEILNLPATNETLKMLNMLLEESLANTCELLSIKDVHNATHRIFHEMNSYNSVYEERGRLNQILDQTSGSFLFKFTFLSYLCSNYLLSEVTEKQLDQMFKLCLKNEKSAKTEQALKEHRRNIRAILKITFALNPRFREVTTAFYAKLNNINTPLNTLLKFDFLEHLNNEPQILNLIHSMSEKIL